MGKKKKNLKSTALHNSLTEWKKECRKLSAKGSREHSKDVSILSTFIKTVIVRIGAEHDMNT